jgi:hypothetical protein
MYFVLGGAACQLPCQRRRFSNQHRMHGQTLIFVAPLTDFSKELDIANSGSEYRAARAGIALGRTSAGGLGCPAAVGLKHAAGMRLRKQNQCKGKAA